MTTQIFNCLKIILRKNEFTLRRTFASTKQEDFSDSRFATIECLSKKLEGQAADSDGSLFSCYDIELKITLYFATNEENITAFNDSREAVENIALNKFLNITNVFAKELNYSAVLGRFKRDVIIKLNYTTEAA